MIHPFSCSCGCLVFDFFFFLFLLFFLFIVLCLLDLIFKTYKWVLTFVNLFSRDLMLYAVATTAKIVLIIKAIQLLLVWLFIHRDIVLFDWVPNAILLSIFFLRSLRYYLRFGESWLTTAVPKVLRMGWSEPLVPILILFCDVRGMHYWGTDDRISDLSFIRANLNCSPWIRWFQIKEMRVLVLDSKFDSEVYLLEIGDYEDRHVGTNV